MRIDRVKKPESSFLSMEKDAGILIETIAKNERLKRLLYYNVPDALDQPDLTPEQSRKLFKDNIKMVPKLRIENEYLNYLIIRFKNFEPNETNPQFRDNIIAFDILVPFDHWQLKDYQLRPYKIAAELDSALAARDYRLTGIGHLEFKGSAEVSFNNEYGGVCLQYKAIHGEEDKKPMPNPFDNERFLEDFEKMLNS